jgi:DNA-directed RNA polymerase alpha subunit
LLSLYQEAYKQGLEQGKLERSEPAVNDDASLMEVIEALPLGVRAYNCLRNSGIKTIGELCRMSRKELCRIKSLGTLTADEIAATLEAAGYAPQCWGDASPELRARLVESKSKRL